MKNKICFFLILLFSFFLCLYSLNKVNLNQNFNNILTDDFSSLVKKSFIKYTEEISSYKFNNFNSYIYSNNSNKEIKTNIVADNNVVKPSTVINKEPIIYLYNTHQREKYANGTLGVYELNPTVLSVSYLIKDMLQENGINAIVEEKDIIKEMNKRKYNYDQTYLITRELIKNNMKKNPSIKYFIDIHRDSVSKSVSTVTINKKSYARVMFVAGMKNKNNSKNLKFMEGLNNKIKKEYPGLSRGIYKKNYVYNQDVNPGVILIEVGGQSNTMEEVYNTCNALSKVLIEYIGEDYE